MACCKDGTGLPSALCLTVCADLKVWFKLLFCGVRSVFVQGFSYLSEVRARGLLEFGEKHLDYQNWVNLMQSERTGPPF